MFKKAPYIFCVLLIISGFVLAQIPKWAQSNSHKKYPNSDYLLGVGIAEDKTKAVELARADVAKQIQVKIESELETMEQEIGSGDRSTIHSEVTSKTKSIVSETVAGIEIVESENIKGKHYVLAVLNKQNYLAGLQQEMDKIIAESNQYLQSARDLVQKGNLFNALDNYISAQKIVPDFYIKRGLYTALTGTVYGDQNTASVASILSEIRTILAAIDVKIISGNNQTSSLGVPLKEPVVARVFYKDSFGNDIGLKWYPVIVKYANGETINKLGSSDKGTLSVNIIATPTGGATGSGAVNFTLGLSNLPDIFRNDLSKIQATVNYSIVTADLSFSIEIKDINDNTNKNMGALVGGWVNNNGYRNDPTSNLKIQGTAILKSERIIDSPAGRQYFIELELPLSLNDTNANTQLASVVAKGNGMALGSRENAVQKACENISVTKSKFAAFLQTAIQP